MSVLVQIQNRWPETVVDSQSVDSQSNECACPDNRDERSESVHCQCSILYIISILWFDNMSIKTEDTVNFVIVSECHDMLSEEQ